MPTGRAPQRRPDSRPPSETTDHPEHHPIPVACHARILRPGTTNGHPGLGAVQRCSTPDPLTAHRDGSGTPTRSGQILGRPLPSQGARANRPHHGSHPGVATNRRGPVAQPLAGDRRALRSINPAPTYSLGLRQYHRLGLLNDCVRNGNRCGQTDMGTGKKKLLDVVTRHGCALSSAATAKDLGGPFCVTPREGRRENVVKSIGLLVLVSSMHHCTYTSSLSTWCSTRSLMGKPYLGVGFALICLQHLSFPNVATQRCR